MHEFKEEGAEHTVTLMNSKITTEQKRSGKLLEDMKKQMMEVY